MVNGVIAAAIGRPGRGPELGYTPNGNARLSFPLAVEDAKKCEGDETQWLRVSVWGERAEARSMKIRKGGLRYVEGRCKVRTWTAGDGTTRADLELSVRRCEALFQHGRRLQADSAAQLVGTIGSARRMSEGRAVGVQPNRRQQLGLDDEDATGWPE